MLVLTSCFMLHIQFASYSRSNASCRGMQDSVECVKSSNSLYVAGWNPDYFELIWNNIPGMLLREFCLMALIHIIYTNC